MKRYFLGFGVLAFCLGILAALPVHAEEDTTTTAELSDTISPRLSVIERKQDEILTRLEEMKAELQIIKVRVSLKT